MARNPELDVSGGSRQHSCRKGPEHYRHRPVLRQLLRRARDEIKPSSQPTGLFQESFTQVELQQPAIALHDIEPDAFVQLAQIDRTQVHRASIALGEVIRAIHEAMKIDAMRDAEHMRHLVRQHLAAPLEKRPRRSARMSLVSSCRLCVYGFRRVVTELPAMSSTASNFTSSVKNAEANSFNCWSEGPAPAMNSLSGCR